MKHPPVKLPIGDPIRKNLGTSVIGKAVRLTTDGTLTAPTLPQPLEGPDGGNVITHRDTARQWIVTTQGVIQKSALGAIKPLTYPLACFKVSWTIEGTSFETRIDGNSDQSLSVVAEQVIVTAMWDEENAVALAPALAFPEEMVMSAGLSPAEGLNSKAFRTRVLQAQPEAGGFIFSQQIPIPYLAKGYIMRGAGWLGADTVFEVGTLPAFVYDTYTAANLAAAHGSGIYLPVPSMADFVRFRFPAASPPTGLGAVEFLLEP